MILLREEERKAKGVLSVSLGLQAGKAQSYKGNNNREELSKEIGHFYITSMLFLDESKGPRSQPRVKDEE